MSSNSNSGFGLLILLGLAVLVLRGGGSTMEADELRAIRSAQRRGEKAFRVEYESADADEIADEIITAPTKAAAIKEMRRLMSSDGTSMRGARFEAEEL